MAVGFWLTEALRQPKPEVFWLQVSGRHHPQWHSDHVKIKMVMARMCAITISKTFSIDTLNRMPAAAA
jgi:hypothetical protein